MALIQQYLNDTIHGMTCSHCRESATKGLMSLPFASRMDVDLKSKSGRALIWGAEIDSKAVSKRLKALGFTGMAFR